MKRFMQGSKGDISLPLLLMLLAAVALSACSSGGGGGGAAQGQNSTILSTQTAASLSDCPNGGIEVDSGIDTNSNGILDPSEVTTRQFVCNGTNGTSGVDGTNGTNGSNGSNGTSVGILTTPEAPGANCANGGWMIQVGPDTNGDGLPDTITSTAYVCNGATGPHGSFTNSTSCIDCHHMSAMAIAMGIPIRPRENGGASLVIGITGNNVANFKTATAGTPVGLTAVSSFTWIDESTGATNTVNVTGVYWQYMDGLPSSITGGAVSSPTITVTIPTGLDYRAQLVNMALLPGTSWDPNRYRAVPINDTNLTLATMTRYLLTVFGDDGKVYWDLIGVKASDAATNEANYAIVHTTGEPVVPINVPVLLTAQTSSMTGGWTPNWSISSANTYTAPVSFATDTYPYFTPTSSGTFAVTDVNTGATVTLFAGTWRGVLVGAPTGSLLPATWDQASCGPCHSITDNPLNVWTPAQFPAAPNKFTPWSNTGHAKRFTQGLDDSGPGEIYNTTCFNCHTVGMVGTAENNNGFHDQPNYTTFVNNVINTATTPSTMRYANAWSNPTYSLLLQRTNIQCEQCHGPQVNTGAHPGDAGASVAGTRESLDANVCGLCHGAATHHTRYNTWKMSPTGHANYDLARSEGTKASCAACHSAQGNLIYQRQLVTGNPLHSIPSGSITWTVNSVQPQTCAVCHDPHNVGTESDDAYFTPEQVNNNSQPRLALLMSAAGLNPGDTPRLPAGFKATGVGKGGQCIICHNSRVGDSGSNSYLHEDNDPVFGALAGYSTPHVGPQGDLLMGHNAYFMGSSGGDASAYRSGHSMLPDTCVTCHMEKTPPQTAWTENAHGTNHTFKADINICTECHTGLDTSLGPKLQMDTQTSLGQVMTAINGAIVTQATGTYQGNIASASYNAGYMVTVNLVFNDTTTASNVPLGNVVDVTTAAGQILAKAVWNYNLIANDKSGGIHNPQFTRNVISNTYSQLMTLQ